MERLIFFVFNDEHKIKTSDGTGNQELVVFTTGQTKTLNQPFFRV